MPDSQLNSLIGWSRTAMNFRRIMRERALAPVSLLLAGEHGTGRKEMANLWRNATGSEVPVVDLDRHEGLCPDRCIAVTTRPIQSRFSEQHAINLATNQIVTHSDLTGEPIEESILTHFALKLFVPPLRQRRMDILANAFWHVTQQKTGNRSVTIGSRLIHRLFLDAGWSGNDREMSECLAMALVAASRRSGSIEMRDDDLRMLPTSSVGESHTAQLLPSIQPSRQSRSLGMSTENWTCDNVDVPIDRLPVIAISILFHAFWKDLGQIADHSSPTYVLGDDSRWLTDAFFEQTDVATLSSRPPAELFQDWNLGFAFPANIVEQMTHFNAYGSTIVSLLDGFGEMVQSKPDTKSSKVRKRRATNLTTKQIDKYIRIILLKQRGLTFQQIGEDLSITRQAAKQLHDRAIANMQNLKSDPG